MGLIEEVNALSKQVISASDAPAAIGPYSQAIKVGGFLFISGQGPLDPYTGRIVTGDIVLPRQDRQQQNDLIISFYYQIIT